MKKKKMMKKKRLINEELLSLIVLICGMTLIIGTVGLLILQEEKIKVESARKER